MTPHVLHREKKSELSRVVTDARSKNNTLKSFDLSDFANN